MTDIIRKEPATEPKIGDVAATQPCSGTTEVVSQVLGVGVSCVLPGATAIGKGARKAS